MANDVFEPFRAVDDALTSDFGNKPPASAGTPTPPMLKRWTLPGVLIDACVPTNAGDMSAPPLAVARTNGAPLPYSV